MTVAVVRPGIGWSSWISLHATSGPSCPDAAVAIRRSSAKARPSVWEVSSGFVALSAHVQVGRDNDCHAARRSLERLLHDTYEIEHTTLQVDHEGGDLLQIET